MLNPVPRDRSMTDPGFPDPDKLKHLSFLIGKEKGGYCSHLLDYNGVRYHLLLDYDYENADCVENKYLQKCYDSAEREEELLDGTFDSYVFECLELFWPFVQKADAERERKTDSNNQVNQAQTDDHVKIQVVTRAGCLQAIEHQEHFKYPEVGPVENNFPSLTLFAQSEVERVAEIATNVYKVIIRGDKYCLKTVYRCGEESFRREVEQLVAIPEHSNIVKVIGITDAGEGTIDGLVLGFISGVSLSKVSSPSTAQKEKWKRQVSETISFLHVKGFLWGDAKPSNVLIDKKTDDAVLIDFGGGFTDGWVDRHLAETAQGDMQGLYRIMKYIDNLEPDNP